MGKRSDRRVYKRRGKWWGVIPREVGESPRESLGIPSSAPETEAVAIWVERARGLRAADVSAATPRVASTFDAYIAEQRRRGRSEATREIDDAKAGHFVRVWGRDMPLREVTAARVATYVETREWEGASPSTIARELVVLRGALKLAIHRGTFATPLERVMPLGYSSQYEPRARCLTQAQARAIYRELPEERRGWFAFALATGARRSEIERARLEDVGDGEVFIRGTKTTAARASVPISSLQQPWLDLALEHAKETGHAFGTWTNVLRGLDHARLRLETCAACRAGKRKDKKHRATPDPKCAACSAMPKIGTISPNDLRRTLGQWLRDAGLEPHLIAKVLRHVDSRMAERVYARGSKAGIASLIEAQLAVRHPVRHSRKTKPLLRHLRRAK